VDRVEAYTDTRGRLLTLGRSLDESDGATRLPSCPEWTVRDLYAHLVGINADALAGRLEGVAEDWWTQRQVDERCHCTLAKILDEWDEVGPAFLAVLGPDSTPPQLLLDSWTHEQDIRGAVRVPGGPSAEVTRDHAVMLARPQVQQIGAHRAATLAIDFGDVVVAGDEPAGLTLTIDPHEYLRGAFGRRSRRQIRAWDWQGTGDADPPIDAILVFGAASKDLIETVPN
jgi:uncharacterized protein (TIGR03083 family)